MFFYYCHTSFQKKEGARMSGFFRGLLIAVSCFFFWYVLRKIRKSQLQIEHSIFWVGLSVIFIIFSIFPQSVYFLTNICGMVAPVNFLFLAMIFLLLIKIFTMSIRMGQMEEKIKNLAQQIAIRNNEVDKKMKEMKTGVDIK